MISVAMAAYNGEKYIKRQIESVLDNLEMNDELIISDDGSTDKTLEIINSFQDLRIRIVKGPHKGINQNFANAIYECKGDYIFLCDQDDIWYKNKVKTVRNIFLTTDYLLIEHDARVINNCGNVIYASFFKYRRVRNGFFKNWLRNTYHGCCIAFRKELKNKIFPFPNNGCLHDQWIGLVAEMNGKTYFLSKILMDYVRHERNASSFVPYPRYVQLINRLILAINLLLLWTKNNI